MLRRAITLIAEAGADHDAIEHYSINISGQSITDEHFVDYARGLIEASSVDPKRLVFEITETTAVTNTRRAGELIRSLRALGCRFSLDDFGSGLSSFSYLKNLPSDFIKIDGKLVSNILQDPVERSIVEAINQVGQAMGLLTVAEHVESRALLEALRSIGVDYVQGYHVARPIPFEMLSSSLGARQRVVRAR
jgi:EAL domain-containing protein (putative c-di-GMP-specific phosphodiesterase class I)